MWFTLALAFLPQAVDGTAPNRIDLGTAYMRFERALARHPLREDRVAEVNRAFDALTVDFFMGNGSAAIEKLDALTRSLVPPDRLEPGERVDVCDLHVEIEPLDEASERIQLVQRGNWSAPSGCEPLQVLFRARSRGDVKIVEAQPAADSAEKRPAGARAPLRATLSEPRFVRDAYDSGLACPPQAEQSSAPTLLVRICGELVPLPYAFLETSGLVACRTEVAGLLDAVEPDGPPLEFALAACRARAALLAPGAWKTSTYLIGRDVHALAAEVHREAHALTSGTDPYRRLRGDTWRVVHLGKSDVPVRVFAPRTGDLDQPSPLLVLFHGMGGDENMFFDGYGAGRIKELAEERHFVCVAPRGGFAPLTAESFDVLVRAMLFDYAIDPKRVYVLGHSMGAGAAFDLAASRSDRIAAAACIAGGAPSGELRSLAPLLVVAGELDSLVSARPLVARAERLAREGFSVEVRTVPNQGHTLVVGATLPAVVDWLLAHPR